MNRAELHGNSDRRARTVRIATVLALGWGVLVGCERSMETSVFPSSAPSSGPSISPDPSAPSEGFVGTSQQLTPSPSDPSSHAPPPSKSSNPASPSPEQPRSSTEASALPPHLPAAARVSVSVATLWRSPSAPRAVDRPALANPVDIRAWLSAMSLAQRLDLNGRVDSQLLLGEEVIVDRIKAEWAHVVVPDQPTPKDVRGYPGWIPLRQLVFGTSTTATQAVVVSPTAWLVTATGARIIEVSAGSRLDVLDVREPWVDVRLPDRRTARLRAADVVVVRAGAGAYSGAGADVLAFAERFSGLAYLWGGTSGFGFDCSGFTHIAYRMFGVTIPRDADAQFQAGVPVARGSLQPGDLVFFARNGYVHHVGFYLGNGLMLHAPQTGRAIEVVSLSSAPYVGEYAGARRYTG